MGSEESGPGNGPAESVDSLCEAALILNSQRGDLDRRLMALPEHDERHEQLWQELEAVQAQLSDVVLKLSNTPSTELDEMRRKAGVLRRLLDGPAVDATMLSPEVLRLALAIASEVSVLL